MYRLVCPLFILLLQIFSISKADPGKSGYAAVEYSGRVSGDLLSNIGSHVTGALNRAQDNLQRTYKRVAAEVSHATAGVSADFSASINKNVNVKRRAPRYETRYVKVDAPVEYRKTVEVPRKAGGSPDTVPTFQKQFEINVPEVKYETRYVKVDTPVKYVQRRVIERPAATGGFFATFEKNFNTNIPYNKYRTHYVTVDAPVEYKEKLIEKPIATGELITTFNKNIPDKQETNFVIDDTPVSYQKKATVVETEDNIGTISDGFEASFEKNVAVKVPDQQYESHQVVKVDQPMNSEERKEEVIVKRSNAGLRASGSFGLNVDVPHAKVTVDVEKIAEKNVVPERYVEVQYDKAPAVETRVAAPDEAHIDVRKSFVISGMKPDSPKSYEVVKDIDVAPVIVDVRKRNEDTGVNIHAPYTSVDVRKSIGGSVDVGVHAPFTHVATSNQGGRKHVQVDAPYTKVYTYGTGIRKNVRVRAPFVDVNTGHRGTIVRAPFVDVITGPKNAYGRASVQVKLPFFNLSFG